MSRDINCKGQLGKDARARARNVSVKRIEIFKIRLCGNGQNASAHKIYTINYRNII